MVWISTYIVDGYGFYLVIIVALTQKATDKVTNLKFSKPSSRHCDANFKDI
jgi:hypothetical protein